MNYRLLFSAALLLLIRLQAAQTQTCNGLRDFYRPGVEMEYLSYDKKGKLSSSMQYKVLGVETQRDTLVVRLATLISDAKGQELARNEMPIKCYEDALIMDLRAIAPPAPGGDNTSSSADLRMEIKGDDMIFPADLRPGQQLPDAEMETTTYMGSMRLMSQRFAVRNRKVEGVETIQTEAGVFECFKISYDFEYRMLGSRTSRTEYWFKPGLGMVKTVSYDKKGGLESRTELAKIR